MPCKFFIKKSCIYYTNELFHWSSSWMLWKPLKDGIYLGIYIRAKNSVTIGKIGKVEEDGDLNWNLLHRHWGQLWAGNW